MKLFASPSLSPPSDSKGARSYGRLSQPLLALLVLLLGGFATWWLLHTRPAAKERKPKSDSVLVEVRPVTFGPERGMIEAFGTVIPARQVELRSQVAGELIWINPKLIPGGLVRTGEVLFRIDPADYVLALQQLAGELVEAEAALKIEEGNREFARREYELSGEKLSGANLDLVLRNPQYDSARARLESARSRLKKAELDLARTEVKAPFDALVQKKEVDLGSWLAVGTPLVSLVATDRYWVEALVPVGQLTELTIPKKEGERGSSVRIVGTAGGKGASWTGMVLRLAADLEERGRLARLLVAIEDPLGLKSGEGGSPSLLIGSYVRVELQGKKYESVAALDRALLRDGDQVWLMDAKNRLVIRPVEVIFRGRDRVLVAAGLAPGERLVVSDLAAPVAGMALRTPDMPEKGDTEKGKQAGAKNGGES